MGRTNFDEVAAALVGNLTGNVTGDVTGNVTGNVTGVVTGGTTPATIADPGASGAIPVTATGRVAIVTAGAETRTLAAPTIVGQRLLLYMKTDGGDEVQIPNADVYSTAIVNTSRYELRRRKKA